MKPILTIGTAALLASAFPAGAQAAAIPRPELQLKALERYTASGQEWVRYVYEVTNKSTYPAELFVASPDLPPCGLNTKASRTWIDFFDQSGKRLYGFCALGSPDDLNHIWFAVRLGTPPPASVYIEMRDRKTQTTGRSNLAGTGFGPCAPPRP
jgi:hypothetical protein